MKKLVKPFKSEEELQLANALCGEYGSCQPQSCPSWRESWCITQPTCHEWSGDLEIGDDILF